MTLVDIARAWLAEDPDPETRAELSELLEAGPSPELEDRFAGTLQFGTAGLRGALGAGPNRMNRVVVIRAAAGLAAYLRDTGATGPVVIGYDARKNSDVFARDTAEVMTGAGFEALLLPSALPTPVLAFAIRDRGAAAGVMVTASHNPPQDNGYKVYLGDGSQIVPPADAEIAARIAAVGPLAQVPRGDAGSVLGLDIVDRYAATVAGIVEDGPRDLAIAYTPLHGVGGGAVLDVLQRAGFPAPYVVASQADPDGGFPTVSFPNPEEPGAMDLALELAAEKGVDIVVANDPDADRCAAAVRVPAGGRHADNTRPGGTHPGGTQPADTWRMLTGDEVGALLAHALLQRGATGTYATSIVSSSLLGKLAADAGQPYEETLTGFKWIGRVEGLAYGYEEALGYCVDPQHVKDKDGVSALLLLCDLAARQKAAGRTLLEVLDDLAERHGVHATSQLSVRVSDLGEIAAAMKLLRAEPPAEIGGLAVQQVDDLALGSDLLPPTEGLRYRLAEGARVIVRPSGTEPKLKCYLEAVVPVEGGRDGLASAREEAARRLSDLRAGIAAAAGLSVD